MLHLPIVIANGSGMIPECNFLILLLTMNARLMLVLALMATTACSKNDGNAPEATGPATSLLQIACTGINAGAEIQLNGHFKGECPLEIKVPAGNFKLTARKKEDEKHDRLFEQEFRLGDGVQKKLEITLGEPRLNAAELSKLKGQGIEVGQVFRDCPECPEMVVLPPGRFTMGSSAEEAQRGNDESPQHKVDISYPLTVGKYEVTFAEWDACFTAGGCTHRPEDEGWGRGRRPVINVSWNDAQEYVKWLSGKTGKPYRLPSESEWEYAARAGTTTPFFTGNCITTNQASYDGTSGYPHCVPQSKVSLNQTAEVGSHAPNAFGLHDLHGNAWEWVQDCYNATYAGAPGDGKAWIEGECGLRIQRGGAWDYYATYLRSAYRGREAPDYRYPNYGFRVAR